MTGPGGHTEGSPRSGQTCKKRKDLCPCDSEKRGCGRGEVCILCAGVSEEHGNGE